jgi:hypothetical protein
LINRNQVPLQHSGEIGTGRPPEPLLAPYVPVRRTIYALYAASRLVPAKTRAFLGVLETSFKVRRGAALDDA